MVCLDLPVRLKQFRDLGTKQERDESLYYKHKTLPG